MLKAEKVEFEKQQIEEIVNAANQFNSRKDAAREAVKLTLELLAKDQLNDTFNQSVLICAQKLATDAENVRLFLENSRPLIQRIENLLDRVANLKEDDLTQPYKATACLYATLLDVTRNKMEMADPRVKVQALKTISYVMWRVLGGSDNLPNEPNTVDESED